jgi:hypothetical protein
MSGFTLSYTANMFILTILYDFCLSGSVWGCLRHQVEPTQLGPIDRASPCLRRQKYVCGSVRKISPVLQRLGFPTCHIVFVIKILVMVWQWRQPKRLPNMLLSARRAVKALTGKESIPDSLDVCSTAGKRNKHLVLKQIRNFKRWHVSD